MESDSNEESSEEKSLPIRDFTTDDSEEGSEKESFHFNHRYFESICKIYLEKKKNEDSFNLIPQKRMNLFPKRSVVRNKT